MQTSKIAKNLSNIIYAIGVLIFAALVGMWIFGANTVPYPEAMIPYSLREQAFIWLAFGAIPMILASMAVYKFNAVKRSMHRKRNFVLIFAPGFVCGVCLLVILGIFAIMVVQGILHIIRLQS